MLLKEKFAVCSQIHTKHVNTMCGQKVEFLMLKLVVPIAATEVLDGLIIINTGLVMPQITREHIRSQGNLVASLYC